MIAEVKSREPAKAIVKRAMSLPFAHKFRLVARLAGDHRVPWRARIPLVMLLVYLAMPLDIIPDFIPVIGQLDDLLVAGIAVWWFLRTCPPHIAEEHLIALEGRALSPGDRLAPWLVGAVIVATAVLVGVRLLARWKATR